jgi:hypothetical protein
MPSPLFICGRVQNGGEAGVDFSHSSQHGSHGNRKVEKGDFVESDRLHEIPVKYRLRGFVWQNRHNSRTNRESTNLRDGSF